MGGHQKNLAGFQLRVTAYRITECQPIHLRHHPIDNEKIRAFAPGQLKARSPILGLKDSIPQPRQPRSHTCPRDRLILNKKNQRSRCLNPWR